MRAGLAGLLVPIPKRLLPLPDFEAAYDGRPSNPQTRNHQRKPLRFGCCCCCCKCQIVNREIAKVAWCAGGMRCYQQIADRRTSTEGIELYSAAAGRSGNILCSGSGRKTSNFFTKLYQSDNIDFAVVLQLPAIS